MDEEKLQKPGKGKGQQLPSPPKPKELGSSKTWQSANFDEDTAIQKLVSQPLPQSPNGGTKKKTLIAIFIFVFLLLFITAGSVTFAYTNYKFFPLPQMLTRVIDSFVLISPLPKTPRLILAATQKKMENLKTAMIETELKFSTMSKEYPLKSAKITIKGPADFKTANQTRSQTEIFIEVASEGIQVTLSGEIRKIGNDFYFKLTEFPAGGLLPLAEIKDQWFVVNIKEFQELQQTRQEEAQTSQKLKEIFEKFIGKAANWTTFGKNSEKEVFLLQITPPKSEIDNFLFEAIEVIEPKQQTGLKTSIEKKNLAKLTENLEKVEARLKVRKKDYYVAEGQLSLLVNITSPPKLFPTRKIALAPVTSIPINLTATIRLSGFNQPVIVEIPLDAKDLKQYSGELRNLLPKAPLATPSAPLLPEPPTEPKSGFRELLQKPSPVLGEEAKFWDLVLLDAIRKILSF